MSKANLPNSDAATDQRWRIVIPAIFLIVIILLFLLLPSSARILYEGTFMEYSPEETGMAIAHDVSIDGYYYSSVLGKDRFRGSFYISDVKGLTNRENNAKFSFDPRYRYSPAFLNVFGEPCSTEVSTLFFDKNFQRLAIQFAYTYTNDGTSTSMATSDNKSTFLVFGATGREEAISQYSQLLGEKLRS